MNIFSLKVFLIALLFFVAPSSTQASFLKIKQGNSKSAKRAIQKIQDQYPQYKNYLTLQTRSIKSELTENGWGIAFIERSNSSSIIKQANCFVVDQNDNIKKTGEYKHSPALRGIKEVSPTTCQESVQ